MKDDAEAPSEGNRTRRGVLLLLLSALALTGDASAQSAATAHTIFITAVEIKGATTAEKLPPP